MQQEFVNQQIRNHVRIADSLIVERPDSRSQNSGRASQIALRNRHSRQVETAFLQ